MRTLARLVSGRRSKWGVLVVWLVLVAALAPLGSKLSNKTDNRTESLPTFALIFLVALGVDYTIFLMSRTREEARLHGTREGMLRAIAATGRSGLRRRSWSRRPAGSRRPSQLE